MRYILARTEKSVTSWLSPSSTTTGGVSKTRCIKREDEELTLLQLGLLLIVPSLGIVPLPVLALGLIGRGITLSVLVVVALVPRLVFVALWRPKRPGWFVALKDLAGLAEVETRPARQRAASERATAERAASESAPKGARLEH
jgi:hypothetical protein